MSKRLLFCVETTKNANTDYPYIRSTIDHYYEVTRQTVLRRICMESKSRYNSKAVQKEIKRQSGTEKNAHVIYCIDTDDYNTSPEAKAQTDRIRDYCSQNGYDFIFFCRNVEDVFHGKSIPGTDKVKAVRRFRTRNQIETIRTANLQREDYQPHCSNILNVLDKYLTRKKK